MTRIEVHTIKRPGVSSLRDALEDMEHVGAVYLGEPPNEPEAVNLELEVVKHLHRRSSDLIIGMEQLTVKQQELIDRFLGGEIGWDYLVASHRECWDTYDINVYRPIIEYALNRKLRVYALSPPRDHIDLILRKGPEALDELPDAGITLEEARVWERLYYRRISYILQFEPSFQMLKPEDPRRAILVSIYKDAFMASRMAEALSLFDEQRLTYGPPAMVSLADPVSVGFVGSVPTRVNRVLPMLRYRVAIIQKGLSAREVLHKAMQPDTIPDYIFNIV